MGEFIAVGVIFMLLLGAYWSFVTLPRQRIFRQHNKYVRELKPGDEVITAGGIIGVLVRIEPETGVAYIKITDDIEVRVLTAALSRPFDPEEIALAAQIGIDPNAEHKLEQRKAKA